MPFQSKNCIFVIIFVLFFFFFFCRIINAFIFGGAFIAGYIKIQRGCISRSGICTPLLFTEDDIRNCRASSDRIMIVVL
jgi:hypothetical protein